MIEPTEELEMFSYESRDVSFAIYIATTGMPLGIDLEFMATVYIDGATTPEIVTRHVNVEELQLSARLSGNIEQYVSTRIAEELNLLFKQIVLYALPNKYVPKRLAEEPW